MEQQHMSFPKPKCFQKGVDFGFHLPGSHEVEKAPNE
jgi:hypothetical protein